MFVVLVHQGDVEEDVFLLAHHPPQSFLEDDGDLVGKRRIVGDAVRDHRRHQMRVAVRVLQPFAVQGGATSGAAQQEAARPLVARRPDQIADPLQTEHRIENEARHHRHVAGAVGGGGRDPRAHPARFGDALF